MPDNVDYERLAALLANPNSWTDDDAAAAEVLRRGQVTALDAVHPRDGRRRASMAQVLAELDAALDAWRGRADSS